MVKILPRCPKYGGNFAVTDICGMFARTYMERGEDRNSSGNGPDMAGAIFMCNQTTLNECFRRKLFGLPLSSAGFVKKVKFGMFLFLFEYDERKLYGVFEAASDGVINSVPRAFSKSGSSFPAQVHFNELWSCHPLRESEFRDAIRENYYQPKKFNVDLSYEQVSKLVELFSSKKLSPRNHQNLGLRSKAGCRSGNNNVTGNAKSTRFDTTEYNLENDMNLKSRFGVHHSMYNQNPDTASCEHHVGIESISYPGVPCSVRPQLPNPSRALSQTDSYLEASPFNHIVPGFKVERQSGVLDIGKPNLAQKHRETQSLHFRSHLYPSETLNLHSSDYHEPDIFNELGIGTPNLPQRLAETHVPQFRSPLYPSQQDHVTCSLPSTDNHGFVSSSSHRGLPFQRESYVNMSKRVNYDSSTSKFYDTNVTDSLGSVYGQSNAHRFIEASPRVDNARGLRNWDLVHRNSDFPLEEDGNLMNLVHRNSDFPLEEDGNLIEDGEPSRFSSGYSSESCGPKEYDPTGNNYFSHRSPTLADSELQSDELPMRTSVFSRLKAPKGFGLRAKVSDADRKRSRDLLRLLAQRANQWNKMARSSKRLLAGSERLESVDKMEPNCANRRAELSGDGETCAEKSMETSFLNFKRRSTSQNMDNETGSSGGSAVSGEAKSKRRKLIRPSFTEDGPFAPPNGESKNIQSYRQEILAMNPVVMNTLNCMDEGATVLEASFGDGECMNPKGSGTQVLEASFGDGECMKLEGFLDGSGHSAKVCAGTVEVLAKLPVCMAGERISSSKSTADINAEPCSVESGIGCSKGSEEKFHVVGDAGAKPNPNEIVKTIKTSNSDHQHIVIKADLRSEGNQPLMVHEEDKMLSDVEVLAKLPVCVAGERNSSSKSTATLVESGIGFSKGSEEKFHVVGDEGAKPNPNEIVKTIKTSNSDHQDIRSEGNQPLMAHEEDTMLSDVHREETYPSNTNL